MPINCHKLLNLVKTHFSKVLPEYLRKRDFRVPDPVTNSKINNELDCIPKKLFFQNSLKMKHEENFEAAKAMESHPMIPKQPPPPLMMALGSLLMFVISGFC